ncbi:hypothetical protein HN51_040313, partial [Arachis hypogaea]
QRSIAVHSSTYGDGAVLSSTGDGAVLSTSPNIATATTHRPFLPFLTATTALNRGALLDGRGAQSQETPFPSLLLLVLPLFLRFQHAAEAFLHLLCSLREKIGGCFAPKMSSLADIFASTNRILTRIHRDWQSEHERWHQLYLGPFDGILSSSLTCQSCSSQEEKGSKVIEIAKIGEISQLTWNNLIVCLFHLYLVVPP